MKNGFTLIELMIVIVIIGILAALAIPTYQDYIARGQVTEALNISSQYKVSISHIYSQTSECPTLSDIGLSTPTDGGTNYIESVNLISQNGSICAVELKFKNSGISNGLRNKHLILALINQTADLGSASWSCTSADISQKYLPKMCSGI